MYGHTESVLAQESLIRRHGDQAEAAMRPSTWPLCTDVDRGKCGKGALRLLPRRDRGVPCATEGQDTAADADDAQLRLSQQWQRISIRCRWCAQGDLMNSSTPKESVVVQCSQPVDTALTDVCYGRNMPPPLRFESVVARGASKIDFFCL